MAPALAKRVEEWVEALWVASVAVGDEWGDAAAAASRRFYKVFYRNA